MLYDKRNDEVAVDVTHDGKLDKIIERLGLTSVNANLYTILINDFTANDISEVNKVSNTNATIKITCSKPVDESLEGFAALRAKYTNLEIKVEGDHQ